MFSYPQCQLEFKVSQTENSKPANCYIQVDGVSTETYAIFDKEKNKGYTENQTVEVYYGYDDDMELVFEGTIDRVIYKFNGGSQSLMMTVSNNARKFSSEIKPISLNGKQTIKSSVESICGQYGYKPTFGDGDFSFTWFGRYGNVGTFEETIQQVLPANFTYTIRGDEIYFSERGKENPKELVLHTQNGLLEYPTEDSKGKANQIKSILLPEIEVGHVINVPIDEYWFAKTNTGIYRRYTVDHYTHEFKNGLGVTSMECSEVDAK